MKQGTIHSRDRHFKILASSTEEERDNNCLLLHLPGLAEGKFDQSRFARAGLAFDPQNTVMLLHLFTFKPILIFGFLQ